MESIPEKTHGPIRKWAPNLFRDQSEKLKKKSFIRIVFFELSQNHVRIIHMLVRVVALYRCTTFLCARIRSTRVDFSCCRWKARCKNYLYGELRSVFSSLPYLSSIAYVIPSALLVPVFLMLLRVSYIVSIHLIRFLLTLYPYIRHRYPMCYPALLL